MRVLCQSPARTIREFPYGSAASDGAIGVGVDGYGRGRVAIQVADDWGYPDGCAVDDADRLWVASWGGGRVGQWSPESGRLLGELFVGAGLVTRVSSVAFGGADLSDLYITTAAPDDAFDYAKEPLAGSLFVARGVGARGREQRPFVGVPAHPPP